MNGHAVRWPKRYRYKEVEYTKFHWTTDGGWTICGRNIVLLPEHCPVMPETSDDENDVDCSICKRLLATASLTPEQRRAVLTFVEEVMK